MQKIIIIGNSCSGKTTLGRELSNALQLHWADLDELHWLPNWVERPDSEFIALIQSEILDHNAWVASGNYTNITKDNLWQEANTIIWLNYSFPTVFYRYITRTFRRIITGEKCCNGNQETWKSAFFSRDILLFWVIFTHRSKKIKFKNWKNGLFKDKRWIELKKPSETIHLKSLLLE